MLGADDPLRHRPRRVLVAGVTGAGKSTLARRIGERLDLPYIEIDGLYHGENWTPRTQFVEDVGAFTSKDAWVTEWQYRSVRPMLAARADTLVWLDHPAATSLSRVFLRTVRRSRSREVLWNGNVEPPLRNVFVDKNNILRWALATQFKYRGSIPSLEASSPHLQIVRLHGQRAVETWLAALSRE